MELLWERSLVTSFEDIDVSTVTIEMFWEGATIHVFGWGLTLACPTSLKLSWRRWPEYENHKLTTSKLCVTSSILFLYGSQCAKFKIGMTQPSFMKHCWDNVPRIENLRQSCKIGLRLRKLRLLNTFQTMTFLQE